MHLEFSMSGIGGEKNTTNSFTKYIEHKYSAVKYRLRFLVFKLN